MDDPWKPVRRYSVPEDGDCGKRGAQVSSSHVFEETGPVRSGSADPDTPANDIVSRERRGWYLAPRSAYLAEHALA